MSQSTRNRVTRALDLLAEGLGPYVDRMMRARSEDGQRWFQRWQQRESRPVSLTDPAFQLRVMADKWDSVFRSELPRSARNLVDELRDVRNREAHRNEFTIDDAYRALDSMERLLANIGAPEARELGRAKDDLLRLRYRGNDGAVAEDVLVKSRLTGLKPWREVVDPHEDVLRGRFSVAEFAADLYQVSLGQGPAEYADPAEFFDRTYLTGGLRGLLVSAARRLAGAGGDPIVDLQTTFGGGKTHSQMALWHLFSGVPVDELPPEVRGVLDEAGVTGDLPAVARVALVGTKLAPGQPDGKPDGTTVRTMWGELAWRLGGREGYQMVAAADQTATNPGHNLDLLLARYRPCLILVDEWVGYARQFFGNEGLPAGTFDTQFSFAQALTEAVRATPDVLLVVSLPVGGESGIGGTGSAVELGGPGGREALNRLRAVLGRIETPWRPASAEEGFEIVRRRLFREFRPEQRRYRNDTARAFGELYRRESADFPASCREAAYVDKIKGAYPIHPELFARLYEDWSTLERFQLTRGVLRLLAGVVFALWEGGDQSPLILPASVPLAHPVVSTELVNTLEDNWRPIIDSDVDGPTSLPAELDNRLSHLGRYHAARRVARTVFLGSAPTFRSATRGVDAARVRLGCALPGETLAAFGDALHRLSGQGTYFYADTGRYWYGLQPSVGRLARDRAEQLRRDALDEIHADIVRRLRTLQRERSAFRFVHPAPGNSADVPDEPAVRLVVLGPDEPHAAGSTESTALGTAGDLLDARGNQPREYRNCLIFLAADSQHVEELEAAVADHLAWTWVVAESGATGLNLDAAQAAQAQTKLADADRAVRECLEHTYQWLLVPEQAEPTGPITWNPIRVEGQAGVIERASERLAHDGYLYLSYPPVLLRQRLDTELAAMWQTGHIAVATLWEPFARYSYLPRLRDFDVLSETVAAGTAVPSWRDTFAVADGFENGRYLGLVAGDRPTVRATTLVVRPDHAAVQLGEPVKPDDGESGTVGAGNVIGCDAGTTPGDGDDRMAQPQRFYGAVTLNPTRLSRDFGNVAQEVVAQLTSLLGTQVEVTVEIKAHNPEGFPDTTVRNVTENARELGFETGSGFEHG
jgi:predicted AAA+ superfamily ATPase